MAVRSVFISYSHDDVVFANTFAAALTKFGLNVWKDDKDILIGDNILKTVYAGIRSASHFCCIVSAASIQSAWVEEELSFAKIRYLADRSLRIVPVLIDKVDIPHFLQSHLCAHLENRDTSLENAEFLRILKAFGTDLTDYQREILTGVDRKRLLSACEDLITVVAQFREILGRFQDADNEHSNAIANRGYDPPRRSGSLKSFRITSRPTTHASDYRIRQARERAAGVLKVLRSYAATAHDAVEQFTQVWHEVDPSRNVPDLRVLLSDPLDLLSHVFRTVAGAQNERSSEAEDEPDGDKDEIIGHTWWVHKKLSQWIASVPEVEASIRGAIALLESWESFDPLDNDQMGA